MMTGCVPELYNTNSAARTASINVFIRDMPDGPRLGGCCYGEGVIARVCYWNPAVAELRVPAYLVGSDYYFNCTTFDRDIQFIDA